MKIQAATSPIKELLSRSLRALDDTEASSISPEPLTEEEGSEDSSLSGLTDALSSVEEGNTESSSSSDENENSVSSYTSAEISSLSGEETTSK